MVAAVLSAVTGAITGYPPTEGRGILNWRGVTRNTLLTEGRDNSPEDDDPVLVAGTPLNMSVAGPSCQLGPPSSSVSESQCGSATATAAGFVVAQGCGTDNPQRRRIARSRKHRTA